MPTVRKVLRQRSVCERLGLSRTTVWRMAKEGKFPRAIKLTDGNAFGYYEDEVVAWQQQREAMRDYGIAKEHA